MPVQQQLIQQAYRFALDPTPTQARQMSSHVGGGRFAYNWGLTQIADALDAYAAEKQAGVEKPTVRIPGHFDLCKMWTAHKDAHPEELHWVGENFVGTYQAALRDVAGAWSKFLKARGAPGRRVGRPRYKSKHRSRKSFQVHGTVLRLEDAKHIRLPKIGMVHLHESARKAVRRLGRTVDCPPCGHTGVTTGTCTPCKGKGAVADLACAPCKGTGSAEKKCAPCKGTGTIPMARIVRGTVSQDSAGRWYVALTVEMVREIRTGPSARQQRGGTIGIDFGTRDLAVLSNGVVIPNPRPLEGSLDLLRKAQQALSRKEKGSRRREKAVAKVGRLHARVRHVRGDAIQKTTSELVHGYARIGMEGWDVQQVASSGSRELPKRLRQNRNRALADTGIGEARWQITSKSRWYGTGVTVTDKHTPTGRTCSACGTVKDKPVPMHHEEFTCGNCGHRAPRRLNTARVLQAVAAQHNDAPSGGESQNARGGGVSPVPAQRQNRQPPVKREARARPPGRGKTGTPGT